MEKTKIREKLDMAYQAGMPFTDKFCKVFDLEVLPLYFEGEEIEPLENGVNIGLSWYSRRELLEMVEDWLSWE